MNDISIVLTHSAYEWSDLKEASVADERRAEEVSQRLDNLEERAAQLLARLPPEVARHAKEEERPALRLVRAEPYERLRRDTDADQPSTWNDLCQEASEGLRRCGTDPETVVLDDLLAPDVVASLERRFDTGFTLEANLDRYDVMAAVVAGLVAAAVDFFIVRIPADHMYLGKYMQEGSPLTQWLDSKSDPDQHWIAGLAKRLESGHKTSFDAVKKAMPFIEGFHPRSHRLQTFGHDPLLGLIIGTMDVMSGGLTGVSRDGMPIYLSDVDIAAGLRPPVHNVFAALWSTLMHMVSDFPTKMGLQPPAFTLLQAFNVGSFGENDRTIGELARFMYLKGYDSRHFLTMSTSVAAAEVVLRGYYFVRRHFDEAYDQEARHAAEAVHARSWRASKHPRFMGMKLLAHTVAAAANVGKVAFYQGNPLAINYAQWLAFTREALRFTRMKTRSPSDVLMGQAYANARAIDDGWSFLDVTDDDFPTLVDRPDSK